MSVIGKLHCGGCQQIIKFNESVIIGDLYTVVHVRCFHLIKEYTLDSGKFGYIANKYLD
ncbi:hypothetical protein M3638_01465 [Oceanobacillus profundus]|uniref:hypothetical protein n=1 Tax=Oceanobacillus profundus TaxID=372463 RepID=UPI00203BA0CB|nr:hypothetical protein [Oceanobacillus profundus]MCM3396503.1 hypothetical protein [Oceanobacillus profundus]